ncbi:MAG: FtsX-like permease family protein, partial [Zoogloea sp.]|nr:FtsX-like permease family protein [Zoogloea sp.]
GAKPGDPVTLGSATFRMGAVVTFESDRGANFFSVLPRLMMNLGDLPATGLVQEGSRITWRLHVAGTLPQVAAFERWMKPQIGRGEKLENIANARPEVRNTLDRAERFLRLAAMLTVVLAAVAIGMAARRYLQRHLDGCAVMRCLGAGQRMLTRLVLAEFLLLGLLAGVAGCAVGFALQFSLAAILDRFIKTSLPPPGPLPAVQGVLLGIVLLAGFAMPALLRLSRVPTVRVLRREWAEFAPREGLAWALGAGVLVACLFWTADDLKLGALVSGGFALAFGLFWLLARAGLVTAGKVRSVAGSGWRYGLASLNRRLTSSLTQAVALAMALTALLLLTLVRADLLEGWRNNTPPDAPNRFVLNIQPEQRDAVSAFFASERQPAPGLEPMVRGRLAVVNGKPVKPDDYEDERAQHLVEREFNLSFDTRLPGGNEVVAGRWYGSDATPQFSVEQGLAQTLGLKLGDEIAFDVAGQQVGARITSLRKLDWNSMRVNFFVVSPPPLLRDFPASYITSFFLPQHEVGFTNRLVAAFPNLTVIDVAAVLGQLQAMMDQVSDAVQFVSAFSLLAGLAVLFAALQSTHEEREYELAVLRTLGARNVQLRNALLAEFSVLGLIAGTLAGIASIAIGWALAHFAFKLEDYSPSLLPLLAGAVAGCVVVTAGGWLGTRRLLTRPAMASLRAAG